MWDSVVQVRHVVSVVHLSVALRSIDQLRDQIVSRNKAVLHVVILQIVDEVVDPRRCHNVANAAAASGLGPPEPPWATAAAMGCLGPSGESPVGIDEL